MSRRNNISYNRCPPGVFCIENATLFIISITIIVIVITVVTFIYFYFNNNKNNHKDKEDNVGDIRPVDDKPCHRDVERGLFPRPNYTFSNVENDVLLNPYKEPVRDDRYLLHSGGGRDPMGMPINIQTQGLGVNTEYRQVGILTKGDAILPLMGRPLFSNRDKWNFYTMNDKANMIKLPMKFKNKDCLSEQGCDNIYNGDQVFVEGYGALFKATIYENNVMRYLPFL